jgi:hypothetical protein
LAREKLCKCGEEYARKYSIKTQFVCVFIHYLFEPKSAMQNYIIRSKESVFIDLQTNTKKEATIYNVKKIMVFIPLNKLLIYF